MIVIPLLPRSNSDCDKQSFPRTLHRTPRRRPDFAATAPGRFQLTSWQVMSSELWSPWESPQSSVFILDLDSSDDPWQWMSLDKVLDGALDMQQRRFGCIPNSYWHVLTNRGWWRALVIKLNHVTSSPVKGVTLNLACHADPMWYQKGTEDRKRSESVISYHPHRNSCSKVKTMNSWDTWKVLMGTPTVVSDRLDHSDHSLKKWLWWNSRKWG